MYSEEEKKIFFFDAIQTTHTNDTIFTTSLSSEINEIRKEVPRWEYQLIDDIEVGLDPTIHTKDPHICCRLPGEQIVFSCETLFSKTDEAYNRDFSRKHPSIDPSPDFRIPHFLREMDFDREIIRGSVHGQRHKIAILKLFQANVHSPIFVDNYPFGGLFDDIVQYVKEYFRKPGTDNSEFLQFQKVQEERRKKDQKDEIENRLEKIEEAWESILYGLDRCFGLFGIQWDLREVNNYDCYEEFDWEVQWKKEGDSLACYLVRIGEMVESIKIIQRALEGIPGGPYENFEIRCFDREKEPEWNDFEYRFTGKKSSPTFDLPKQELYVRIEAPKGELGFFSNRRSEWFSLEMENSSTWFYQFAISSSIS
ncbi:hypothetical protein KIW84_064883 [Lathyrus oleraceus]|uniref:NADH-quinone oxidoreductase subunit D domain-containing protein n=1 Tax=Pisum sativum TaxID=3888 RepID=A0A9D4WFA2_PEA|nr:hypothetical protein KIW84_064883 [Pisum sativum]